eukprot:9102674-Lingulodinium_polyedra.AAC.1
MRKRLPMREIKVVDLCVGKHGVQVYFESTRLSLLNLNTRIPAVGARHAERLTYDDAREILDVCAAF